MTSVGILFPIVCVVWRTHTARTAHTPGWWLPLHSERTLRAMDYYILGLLNIPTFYASVYVARRVLIPAYHIARLGSYLAWIAAFWIPRTLPRLPSYTSLC